MNQSSRNLRPIDILTQGSCRLGISLTGQSINRMLVHLRLLSEWQKRINLTSLRSPGEVAIYHFLDSLVALRVIPRWEGLRILDVGSGGGFPGMVVKAALEQVHMTFLDKDPGKIVFLKHVAAQMDLSGVAFLNSTLDSMLSKNSARNIDLVICRGFSSARSFWDGVHVLLPAGGFLVRMAGPAFEMTSPIPRRFSLLDSWDGFLPFSTSFRRVLLYAKSADADQSAASTHENPFVS